MYVKSLSPSVDCRTKSVLTLKMHIRHYININDMILNIISVSMSLINFETFYNGCIICKSSTLILKEVCIYLSISFLFNVITRKQNKRQLSLSGSRVRKKV